jgi:hypothetical protein
MGHTTDNNVDVDARDHGDMLSTGKKNPIDVRRTRMVDEG